MIKHNYSNLDCKKVRLFLSKDGKQLRYRPVVPKSKFVDFFRGDRVIDFNRVIGVIFGPFSTTFDKRKEKVITALNFESNFG